MHVNFLLQIAMLSLQLKRMLISLLATVPAVMLDPCGSEAATKPGVATGLTYKMIVHNYTS